MTDAEEETVEGLSDWDRQLYRHLTNHVRVERTILEEYSSVAQESSSKAFAYLVNLLIEDEIRHHRIFEDLANSLKTRVQIGLKDPPIPSLDFHTSDRASILAATQDLLAKEREDLQELKRLRKELRDTKDVTLWSVLVELMELDTTKHITTLRFVERHTR